MAQDYLYSLYYSILARVRPNYRAKSYVDKNLSFDWVGDREGFRKYILNELGERAEGMSLDRINNKLGYIRGNLRWATKSTQVKNRDDFIYKVRKGRNHLPRWVDESRCKTKYRVAFTYRKKPYRSRYYSTAEDAYEAALSMRKELGAPIN